MHGTRRLKTTVQGYGWTIMCVSGLGEILELPEAKNPSSMYAMLVRPCKRDRRVDINIRILLLSCKR